LGVKNLSSRGILAILFIIV